MNNYRKFAPVKVMFFIIAAVGIVFITGTVITYLWNAILPDLTGVNEITFWQAVGLFILSKILFSSWHRRGSHGGWSRRARWKQKWEKMSFEERAQFKARWREKCSKTNDE
ncbi:MAG: hypothetical protein HKN76_06910 [Saprospiraceae bacterium]|nr:hypothetical protein [Saprospiraceae bacterium]